VQRRDTGGGFNVVVAAPDHNAGINYDGSASFVALPAALRPQAAGSFSYPAVLGASSYRACIRRCTQVLLHR
jgi:cytosine deaminase